jgi:hypothetical protein
MNDPLRHLVKRAPGIIRNQYGFISERVEFNDGLTLLKMQHASPPEVGKWVRVRKGVYKGDVGCVTSTRSGGVELLLVPRLSQRQASRENPSSHSCSAPTLFDCEAVKRLYDIEPVRIQENIYSFRGDRFEHGLIIKSYSSDCISTTVSCMPFELLCRFLESCHPTLISRPQFLNPWNGILLKAMKHIVLTIRTSLASSLCFEVNQWNFLQRMGLSAFLG